MAYQLKLNRRAYGRSSRMGADWLTSPLRPLFFHFEAEPAASTGQKLSKATKIFFGRKKKRNKMVRRSAEEEAERQPKKADSMADDNHNSVGWFSSHWF